MAGMERRENLSGRRFGRLLVLEFVQRNSHRQAVWLCRCDCGNTKEIPAQPLKRGESTSCGCLHRENHTTHGKSKTRLYRVWREMHGRCYNPKNNRYALYGARGIKVCDEWHDLATFCADVGEPPTPQHQIERDDNDGDYEPSNVRWATPKEQARNRRTTLRITYRGEEKSLAEWVELLGLNYHQVHRRITEYGWSVEQAFNQPIREMH